SVSETVSDMTGRAGTAVRDSSVVQYIRDNPVPFALVGIGLGMLTLNKRKTWQTSYAPSGNLRPGVGDRYRSRSSDEDGPSLTERASTALSSATDNVREA